ncbi:hypothetical protein B0T13DRAFT_100126 [Neurospora crassa]|nr:hypothetical protein B0T13DRAFT_100126 [Neurospora crassa]
MVRTRRMAAMAGNENNGEQSSNATPNNTQPMAVVEIPAKKKKSPVKPKGRKAAKQAARPDVKEEEQGETDVQLPETGTSNTSIAPDNEKQNVNISDQPSANINSTRPSATSSTTSGRRVQPKSTKSNIKAKSKSKTTAVVEPPEMDDPEAEYDSEIPYIPKDLRKELRERLSWAGLTYPETWRPRVDSPFDAPPPPPENPPPADSILVAGLADGEVGYLRQLLRYWTSEDKGCRTANKFFHRLH